VSTVRRGDHDRRRRQPHWARRGIVALLAVLAALGAVTAGAALVGREKAAHAASGSTSAAAYTAVPDAAITQAATHVGRLFTTHRADVGATAVSVLLPPLLLLAPLRSALEVPIARRRAHVGTPLRRGPPSFLAR